MSARERLPLFVFGLWLFASCWLAGSAPPRYGVWPTALALVVGTAICMHRPPRRAVWLMACACFAVPVLHLLELGAESQAPDVHARWIVTWQWVAFLVGWMAWQLARRTSTSAVLCTLALALAPVFALAVCGVGAPGFDPRSLGWSAVRARPLGSFLHPNHLATLAGAATVGALAFTRGESRHRVPILAFAGLAFACVLLSHCRAVLLLVLVLGPFAMLRKRLVLPAIAVLLASFVLLAPQAALDEWALGDRFRIAVWRDTLSMIEAAPWIGVGPGGFEEVFPAFDRDPAFLRFTHPESTWLTWLAEYGLLGALPWFVLVVWTTQRLVRRRSAAGRALRFAWILLLAHATIDFTFYTPAAAYCASVVAGLAWARSAWRDREEVTPLARRVPSARVGTCQQRERCPGDEEQHELGRVAHHVGEEALMGSERE